MQPRSARRLGAARHLLTLAPLPPTSPARPRGPSGPGSPCEKRDPVSLGRVWEVRDNTELPGREDPRLRRVTLEAALPARSHAAWQGPHPFPEEGAPPSSSSPTSPGSSDVAPKAQTSSQLQATCAREGSVQLCTAHMAHMGLAEPPEVPWQACPHGLCGLCSPLSLGPSAPGLGCCVGPTGTHVQR